MAITAANIETEVADRLTLTVSSGDLNDDILRVLLDISARVPGILQKTGSLVFADAEWSKALPAGFNERRELTDANGRPLIWVHKMSELMAKFRGSTDDGVPTHWTIFNQTAYIYPGSSGGTTLTLYYCYFDTVIGSITMPDLAFNAIVEGVCKEKELDRGTFAAPLTEGMMTHQNLYDREIAVLNSVYGKY